MESKGTAPRTNKVFKYLLIALLAYIAILLGYHSFKIIEYFLKPVPNPLLPINAYKYIAFPYISFIPFLVTFVAMGIYFVKKEFYKKGTVIFYAVLILLFHLFQSSLLELFDSFNPYGG